MTYEDLRARILADFNRSIFPEPIGFSDPEIEAIATHPGVDLKGTFADGPMERSLMNRYDLDSDRGENTWPAFASVLREEKLERLRVLNSEREYALLVEKFTKAKRDLCLYQTQRGNCR